MSLNTRVFTPTRIFRHRYNHIQNHITTPKRRNALRRLRQKGLYRTRRKAFLAFPRARREPGKKGRKSDRPYYTPQNACLTYNPVIRSVWLPSISVIRYELL